MKIACLQLAPELGKVKENIARANEILQKEINRNDAWSTDILVLPELAFSGRAHHSIAFSHFYSRNKHLLFHIE